MFQKKAISINNNEQKRISNDITRLIGLSNKKIISEDYAYVEIDKKISKTKKYKKLLMVLEFLKFYKKNFNPFVHIDHDNIDYYLFPKSLFNDDRKYIECIEQMLTLKDFIPNENPSNKNNIDPKKMILKLIKIIK